MTSNLYLYHLHEILSETSGTESFIGTVAKGMLEKLGKYWNNMFDMPAAFAMVLDPRFKMKYKEFICSKVGSLEAYKAVKYFIHNLYDACVIGNHTSCPGNNLENAGSFTVSQEYHQFRQLKSELDRYLPVLAIPMYLGTYPFEGKQVNEHLTELHPEFMNALFCSLSWFEEA